MAAQQGRTAVYAGSFDPITLGHLDVIERAGKLFDKVIVAVGNNVNKKYLFSLQERTEILKDCVVNLPYVTIDSFDGLLVDFCKDNGACAIVRGLRVLTDFDYEFQIGLANMDLAPEIETIFLLTNPQNIFISSSLIKELGAFDGNIEPYLPPPALERVQAKLSKK